MTEQTPSSGYGKGYGSAYGKRPMWQWVLLYIVIGGALYALVYYFVFAKKGGYSYNQTMTYPTVTPAMSPEATPAMSPTTPSGMPSAMPSAPAAFSDNIYLTKTNAAKGKYMTDFEGKTLYVFDKDTTGVSNCYGGCASVWPPYSSGATAQKTLPKNITVIKRTDGSTQFAWMGKPLYYYTPDKNIGDVNGDGVGGVWHIVKM